MTESLKILTEKHSESARALIEHLDCKDDAKGMQLLDEMLEYNVMLVRFLNDFWKREIDGNTSRKQVHGAPATNGR